MIKSITLENFQGHKFLHLDLAEGVNAIVGPSDTGKTTVIRALQWLVFNRPLSVDPLITHGTSSVSVKVKTANGTTVERRRTKTKNLYLIDDEEYKGFGSSVPDDVQKVLNIGDINFSPQHSSPFLLSASPLEVARTINEFANLDDIDRALRNISLRVRRDQQGLSEADNAIKAAQEALNTFSYLSELKKQVLALQRKQAKLNKVKKSFDELAGVVAKITGLQKRVDTLPDLSQLKDKLQQIQDHIDAKKAITKQVSRLARAIDSVRNKQALVKVAEHDLTQAKKRFEKQMPNICPLCGSRRK